MYSETIPLSGDIPIQETRRKLTDNVCTFIGAIFALVMFILACIFFSKSGLNQAYFNQTNTDLTASADYQGFKGALFWTALSALSVGLIWLVFVHCAPKLAPLAGIILAASTLIILGVLTFLTNSSFTNNHNILKILFAVFCFVLAIIIIAMGCAYGQSLRLQGLFLDYAKICLNSWPLTFLYIPIFILLTLGLIAVFVFQHCGFSSKWHSSNNFYDWTNPGVFGWLNIIQFIWGFQFLKDSFNFCVSGAAVDWYWSNNTFDSSSKPTKRQFVPLTRLITRHWGSVVLGSFLNSFFKIPTFIYELLNCHPKTCCNSLGVSCDKACNCCSSIFDMVRTDPYSYINISGFNFCDSAKNCRSLCLAHQDLFVGKFNIMKHYRFVIHVFFIALIFIFGFLFTKLRVAEIGFWHIITLIVLIECVSTWFINLHSDAAEGLLTSFLVEHIKCGQYQNMQKAIPSIRQQIQHRSNRSEQLRDGHC